MKLQDKVAVVVGCSPNINGGIALEMAKEGARLVCVDIEPGFAQGCADEIVAGGGKAIAVTADVTKEDQVIAAVKRADDEFGGIDILVNGAVIQIRQGVLDMPVEQFRRQIDVILAGTFLFTKYAAKLMIERKCAGSIINIVSTEGHQGNPRNIGYGTAKSGLLNFTRSVAMELSGHGIRVNSLTPTATTFDEGRARAQKWGVTWGQTVVGHRPGALSEDQGMPLGKRPSPTHYGRAAVFLASDDAEMITGFDLRVDAGVIGRYWRWIPGMGEAE